MKTKQLLKNTTMVLTLLALTQVMPTFAKSPEKPATKEKVKCEPKKQQKLKATKDKKTGKVIYHCVYVGKKVTRKAWKSRLQRVKRHSQSSCAGMKEKQREACLIAEKKRNQKYSRKWFRFKGFSSAGIAKSRGIYIGGSVGQSTLKPKVNTVGGRITDNTDMGYKFHAGYKFNQKLAVEGFYANMGKAGIDTGAAKGDVDYKLTGVSGIFTQRIKNRLKGIAKLGYAKVDNDVSKGISYKQIEDGVVFIGLGLGYNISSRLSVKGEYEYFDKDIQLMSTALSWQF